MAPGNQGVYFSDSSNQAPSHVAAPLAQGRKHARWLSRWAGPHPDVAGEPARVAGSSNLSLLGSVSLPPHSVIRSGEAQGPWLTHIPTPTKAVLGGTAAVTWVFIFLCDPPGLTDS